MTLKNIMLLGAMAAAMTSCGSDDTVNNGTNPILKPEAYMSLAIAMPASASRTENAGTVGEQKISDLNVLIWDGDGSAAPFVRYFQASDLIPGAPNDPTSGNLTTFYTTKSIPVSKGQKKVIVVVNSGMNLGDLKHEIKPNSQYAVTGSVSDFNKEFSINGPAEVKKISENNKFLMLNACNIMTQTESGTPATDKVTNNGDFYVDGSVFVDVQGNQATPTTVVIPVERVVAKIQETTPDLNHKPVEGTNGDYVNFKSMCVINANKQFYPIKKNRANAGTPYVVDPNFDKQDVNNFFSKEFKSEGEVIKTDFNFTGTPEEKAASLVMYTTENTMIEGQQMNAYTTGVYYKAVYEKEGVTAGTNLFKFAGKILTFTELQNEKDVQLGNLDEGGSIEQFRNIGVLKYEQGVCYYPYWIRHINNNNQTVSGPMEFAVVRNNWYTLKINKVKGIGHNVPETPDPEIPDEIDGMLEVVVSVMPWTVRENEFDL